ncbi:peroxiredoxin family protein [Cyclobacterium jeungdonense]|uniref:Redoxin domain-containing protein n=1 Tax=Cyclobacterium jeungdonense TaxID=708087 RepID=A0ABT8C569_9BACT|nr:redoxin domain-containing protein [Cyclobacterium jeungdonense]MDN3687456.1 redoxin domain-containing protein [Cyclobacterium jeungdonense]
MKLKESLILLVILLFASVSLFDICAKAQSNQDVSVEGTNAPEFSLPDLNGNHVSSEAYKGSYLVIHIATTWCPFCNAEAPHLEQLSQNYKDKNVNVLIIDVKEPKDLVKTQLKDRFDLSFPVLLDSDGSVAARFAPEGVLPDLARDEVMLASNILIDPEGKIQFFSLLDSKNFDAKLVDLKAKLDELLASE